MKQSNLDIESIMKNSLAGDSPSVSFDSVWNKYTSSKTIGLRSKKVFSIPLVALITFLTLFTVGFAGYAYLRNIDNTDYPFINDQQVVGKWETVDFVKGIDEFTPGKKAWKGEKYVNAIAFINDGRVLGAMGGARLSPTSFTWTKGKIINKQEKTSGEYIIKEIKGSTYMFFEWRSGDYIFRNLKPQYYVLKKSDSNDYSGYKPVAAEDNVEYSFVDEPKMKGKWRSIDFVSSISQFNPDTKSYLDDLYLKEMRFDPEGVLTCFTDKGQFSLLWTKGMVVDKLEKTASKCEIREIDGATYMFYEWKNGDYISGGMEPCYYVLKKVE